MKCFDIQRLYNNKLFTRSNPGLKYGITTPPVGIGQASFVPVHISKLHALVILKSGSFSGLRNLQQALAEAPAGGGREGMFLFLHNS